MGRGVSNSLNQHLKLQGKPQLPTEHWPRALPTQQSYLGVSWNQECGRSLPGWAKGRSLVSLAVHVSSEERPTPNSRRANPGHGGAASLDLENGTPAILSSQDVFVPHGITSVYLILSICQLASSQPDVAFQGLCISIMVSRSKCSSH